VRGPEAEGPTSSPDETLYSSVRGARRILVRRAGSELQLLFDSEESCEIQSRLDPARPFDLLSPYTRAAMAALLWRPSPHRVYVVGLGGGRIPAVLGHHFPDARIDCTEVDPEVIAVAARFFGVVAGEQLRILLQDGREFLERREAAGPYDVIVVDAFTGRGSGVARLATLEFFAACRRQLAPGGVLVLSVLPGDPWGDRKLAAVGASFLRAFAYEEDGARVAFGYDGEAIGRDELIRRARRLQRDCRFAFSLSSVARRLWPLAAGIRLPGESTAAGTPLRDADLPDGEAAAG